MLAGGYYFFVATELDELSCNVEHNVVSYRDIDGVYTEVRHIANNTVRRYMGEMVVPDLIKPKEITLCPDFFSVRKTVGFFGIVFGAVLQFISILALISIRVKR